MTDPNAYVTWFKKALTEHRPLGYHELHRIIVGLEAGGMVMGCILPPEAADAVRREVLPSLLATFATMTPPPVDERRRRPLVALTLAEQDAVRELPSVENAAPFVSVEGFAVGGLLAAGFGPKTECLLVVSTEGEGVFDVRAGTKVARRRARRSAYQGFLAPEPGIGPLAGLHVQLAAEDNAHALPNVGLDGWSCWLSKPIEMPKKLPGGLKAPVWLCKPGGDARRPACLVGWFDDVIAVGFSDSGRSFVVAEQHTLHLWRVGSSRP